MIELSSTQKLYEKIAKGEVSGFTVPAFNIRTLTFDTARALFRAAQKEKAAAFIIELAPSEAKYTDQSAKEYKKTILKAAKAENFDGPVFLQGDHFRIQNKEKDLAEIKKKIKKFIKAGFYNLDIDCSLLSINENAKITAELVQYIRKKQPKGLEITIGAEVGVIGGKKTTLGEFQQFIADLRAILGHSSIIKIAIQTGTSHGGIMLASGQLQRMEEDFESLKQISQEARKYGLAGAVQHGASTLPDEYFNKFPETGACEIHLATKFQNIVYDSPYFPDDLRQKIYDWLRKEYRSEKDENDTQFIYRTRKRGLGKFKKQINKIPQENKDRICQELEDKFKFLLRSLKVSNTADLIKEIYGTRD